MSGHNLLLDSYKFNCSFMHIFLYYSAVYFKDWTFICHFLSFVFSEQEKRLVNLFIVERQQGSQGTVMIKPAQIQQKH